MAVKASASITLSVMKDIASTTRYYLLQSSTLSKPSVPTANPPGGNWDDTEPGYTVGSTNSLYTVDLTVFSNGTYEYSTVSLSSSYEAAKAAYNQAVSAKSVAQNAQSTADTAKSLAETATSKLQYIVIRSDGTHFKAMETDNEMVLTNEGLHIDVGGEQYSQFGASFAQFGNYQIRRTSDGGLAFKLKL